MFNIEKRKSIQIGNLASTGSILLSIVDNAAKMTFRSNLHAKKYNTFKT